MTGRTKPATNGPAASALTRNRTGPREGMGRDARMTLRTLTKSAPKMTSEKTEPASQIHGARSSSLTDGCAAGTTTRAVAEVAILVCVAEVAGRLGAAALKPGNARHATIAQVHIACRIEAG